MRTYCVMWDLMILHSQIYRRYQYTYHTHISALCSQLQLFTKMYWYRLIVPLMYYQHHKSLAVSSSASSSIIISSIIISHHHQQSSSSIIISSIINQQHQASSAVSSSAAAASSNGHQNVWVCLIIVSRRSYLSC